MNPKLTSEQKVIIDNAPLQNTIIAADAGSGKTSTIVFTVENLLKKQPSAKILIVVFNVHIKNELRERLTSPNVYIYTMHTLGNSLLKTSKSGQYVFSYDVTTRKYKKILRTLIGNGKGTKTLVDTGFELLNLLRMTNSKVDAPSIYALAQRYDVPADGLSIGSKEEQQFTDRPFDFIFADEAQDFGQIMQLLPRRFAHSQTKFCFVGDSLQAINGYTGSDSYSLDNLSIYYDCAELPLTTVFRNPANHIEKINAMFPKNSTAFKDFDGLWENLGDINLDDIPNDAVILGRFRNGKQAKLWDYFFRLLEKGRDCTLFGINPLQIVEKCIPDELQKDFTNLSENFSSYVIETLQDYKSKGWYNVAEEFQADSALVLRLIENCNCNSWDNFEKWLNGMTYDRKNRVKLSTIHTFKGYESHNVFLLDSSQFPYKAKSELFELQEQAVAYVANTRSSQNMYNIN